MKLTLFLVLNLPSFFFFFASASPLFLGLNLPSFFVLFGASASASSVGSECLFLFFLRLCFLSSYIIVSTSCPCISTNSTKTYKLGLLLI